VWALPQFSLANGVVQQNLLPSIFGPDGVVGETAAILIVSIAMLMVTYFVTWNYNRDRAGVFYYELILKGVVGCDCDQFYRCGGTADIYYRGHRLGGTRAWFIPNPALIFRPAEGFLPLLEGLSGTSRAYWTDLIVNRQQNVIAAALSSAVGINMTFLFAYSILRRKWSAEYQGLMKFDLIGGMLIPFMLVTSCVMIAGTSQFHTVPQPGIIGEFPSEWEPDAGQVAEYNSMLEARVMYEFGEKRPYRSSVAAICG
jgi:hypothetical protein